MEVPEQRATVITNVEYNAAPERDRRSRGLAYLRVGRYASAVRELDDVLGDAPDDPDVHYYLALALLGGVRPNRLPRALVQRVCEHLDRAVSQRRAQVLRAMVVEDYGLSWHHYSMIPPELLALVAPLDADAARELVEHVPARGTRSYSLLERKVAGSP
jgi:hypothetical protein